jgi:hypothetical protein
VASRSSASGNGSITKCPKANQCHTASLSIPPQTG